MALEDQSRVRHVVGNQRACPGHKRDLTGRTSNANVNDLAPPLPLNHREYAENKRFSHAGDGTTTPLE